MKCFQFVALHIGTCNAYCVEFNCRFCSSDATGTSAPEDHHKDYSGQESNYLLPLTPHTYNFEDQSALKTSQKGTIFEAFSTKMIWKKLQWWTHQQVTPPLISMRSFLGLSQNSLLWTQEHLFLCNFAYTLLLINQTQEKKRVIFKKTRTDYYSNHRKICLAWGQWAGGEGGVWSQKRKRRKVQTSVLGA